MENDSNAYNAYKEQSSEAKQKTPGARRAAKCRQRKREQGLLLTYIPAKAAEEIKAAGSFEAWMRKFRPARPPERTARLIQLVVLGKKVEQLPTWLRWLLSL